MRAGEAQQLTWNEIDFERKTVRVTPEKGSNPRILKLSSKLISRLKALRTKKKANEVFGKYLRNRRRLYQKQRATLARKLENPRRARAAASTVKEAMTLIELVFQHVCDFDGVKLLEDPPDKDGFRLHR
jgi:integrase